MRKMNSEDMTAENRTPEHIDKFLRHLAKYWEHHPEMRLGMVLLQLSKKHGPDIFQVDDNVWAARIDAALEEEALLKTPKESKKK